MLLDYEKITSHILNDFKQWKFTTHEYPNAIGLWSGDIKTLIWSYLQSDLHKNWIEVGSFCGGSAVLMCLAKIGLKLNGNVISVDRRPEPIIFDNLRPFENISVLIKTISSNFPKYYNGDPISFAFIDGWHSFKGCYEDFKILEPYLVDGAIICIHDVGTPDNWTQEYIDLKYKEALHHYDEWMSEELPNENTQEQTYHLDELTAYLIKKHNCELLINPINDPKTYMLTLKYHKK